MIAEDGLVDRAALAADLRRARIEFHQLLAEADRETAGGSRRAAPAGPMSSCCSTWCSVTWSCSGCLFWCGCSAGYPIRSAAFSPAPSTPQPDRSTSSTTTAPARPPLVYNRHRMGAKLDRVIASLQRQLDRERDDAFVRGMHYPTRWDPLICVGDPRKGGNPLMFRCLASVGPSALGRWTAVGVEVERPERCEDERP
jgi:hypothetical protein